MKHIIRILPIVVAIEVILLLTGILPPRISAIAIIVTEATAMVLCASVAISLFRAIRKKVSQGHRVFSATEELLKDVLPPKLLWAFKHEIGMFAGIIRLIRGKIDMPTGALAIKQGQQIRRLCAVLLVVGVFEVVAVELLVPWDALRIAVLILSVYGLLWTVGFLASTIVYPHYITKNELVLRFSYYHTVVVSARAICGLSSGISSASENKTLVIAGDALQLNVMGETNFRAMLEGSCAVMHNDQIIEAPLRSISFQVDDPKTARAALSDVAETALSGAS